MDCKTRIVAIAVLMTCLGLAMTAARAKSVVDPNNVHAFLAGAWCGGAEGERIEETWLAPVAGHSIGMSRSEKGGRVTAFEFVRIEPVDGVLTYLAQPSGRPPTAFPLVSFGIDSITFENKAHDFPQRIEYSRRGDELFASISGSGKDGAREEVGYQYKRCTADSPERPTGPIVPVGS